MDVSNSFSSQPPATLSVTRVSRALDRVEVSFDDPNLAANAGLLSTATLADRLGLEESIDDTKFVGRVGGACPGRKVLTLTHVMIAGATHIDHADMLRAGSTAGVLGHRVMAPSTLGMSLSYAEAAVMPRWWLWGVRRSGLGLTDSA